MGREWAAILARYGQTVTVYQGEGGSGIDTRAFLQPILEKDHDFVPSPLGLRNEERFLYLGAPEVELSVEKRSVVDWGGKQFEVYSAREVYVGKELSHYWAVLRPRDREESL